MILITGPTGSGKSTTLYSALQQIVSKEINVLTVEDPVEYVMEGISQVQVGTKVSFASALRSFLRHDPDVIMVGEIRDGETANIAMKASLTGHMVFSTLHTNSAVSTISRLKDIGVEPFLIGTTLVCVIAQRLVRRLCASCKQPVALTAKDRRLLNLDDSVDVNIFQANGCATCHDTGFKGRIALFETLWIDDVLGELIGRGVSEQVILKHAKDFTSLAQDCTDKILVGATSMSEFKRLSLSHGVLANEIKVQVNEHNTLKAEVIS
jgi:type IV pilus assembly protein PilB